MSTLAYAAMTTNREDAEPDTSTSTSAPGVGTYADALAALVPAEVLTLHAMILSVTTKTENATTQITALTTLKFAFVGLVLLSAVFYVAPRLIARKWVKLDYLRALIPPLAFIAWTMMQRATAFDAVFPWIGDAPRTVLALFLGVLLGLGASALAYQADQQQP